jgi:archaemetzincin
LKLIKEIKLISFTGFDILFLNQVIEGIKKEFPFKISHMEKYIDLSEFYDPGRRQYNADNILLKTDELFADNDSKILGLFDVDLFIPIFTYIFGQAYLNGRCGIASLYRLANERYGIKPDNNLLAERFTKEAIHELGHTFGLIHCIVPDCVMRSGTYVEDIDQKNASFCSNCKTQLENNISKKQ